MVPKVMPIKISKYCGKLSLSTLPFNGKLNVWENTTGYGNTIVYISKHWKLKVILCYKLLETYSIYR